MWLLEQLIQECLKWLTNQAGPVGEIALFLLVGLSLLVGGPFYMSRENKRRQAAESKPRYGWIEYIVVLSGGFVFAAVGLALLVNAN